MNESMAGVGTNLGRRGPQTDAPPAQATLHSLTGMINDRIRSITDRQEIVSNGLARLVNPRPVNAVSEALAKIAHEPNSHEDHLHAIIRRLDQVLETAVFHADQVNGAV